MFSRFELEIILRKKELQMIRIRRSQKKEMVGGEGISRLGGQWKGSIAWWPLEGSIA
jgi:hypothetical protein